MSNSHETARAPRRTRWTVGAKIAVACLLCGVIPLLAYATYTYVRTASTLRDLEGIRLVEREVAVGRALDDLTVSALAASDDYANWEPFVAALARGTNTRVRRQLETLAAAPGSLAQVYSPEGKLLVTAGGGALSTSLWSLPTVERLVLNASGGAATAGFETIDGVPWVVSAQYVRPPKDSAPAPGVLVTARPLDAATLASIGATTDVKLAVARADDLAAAAGDQTAGAESGVLNQVGAAFDNGTARSVYLAVYDADGYRAGLVKMSMDRSAVLAATANLRSAAAASLLLALVASALVALLLSRGITRPLRKLAAAAVAMAGGETRQTIEVTRSDEIGQLAGAFNGMSERISERVADLTGKLGSLSSELADINVVFGESVSDTIDVHAELQHMVPRIATIVKADDAGLYLVESGGGLTAVGERPAGGDAAGEETSSTSGAVALCESPAALALAESVATSQTAAQAHADGTGAGGAGGEMSLAAAPLVRGGEVSGVLVVSRRGDRPYDEQETALLCMLAGQVAVAVRNADTYNRLEAGYLSTIVALAGAIEVSEGHAPDHPRAVADVCEAIAARLRLDPVEARLTKYGAVLHDVGKIGVPERILRKPARLSDEEFSVVATHPVIGESILSRIDYLSPVGPVVRAAHEQWDGAGYPDGLAGTQIPLPARIVFAGDAYVAMTSDRPYRKALSHEAALVALRDGAGVHFDPDVVRALLEAADSLAATVGASPRRDAGAERVLVTVLFVDIVDSTARAAAVGDGAWQEELRRFHAVVAGALKDYNGAVIDTAGDGVFARFDSPARAVRCAFAMREALAPLGLVIRAGCHTGEIELAADGVRGLAVHIGARVAGEARPGEVLVSGTVRDLVTGSGLCFSDRGEHVLKGVPGTWRLFTADA